MFKILTLNNISVAGLENMPRESYEVASEITHPDAILLRSYVMHDMEIPKSLKAVGRAGAGVNNIPVQKLSAQGIPVFNAPGANANAVKELVIAGMLMACRNIGPAWQYTQALEGDDKVLHKAVEAGKKKYVGYELPGRTLGVVGLGAIGRLVANAALNLGMRVIGYDPGITVQGAWALSSQVQQANGIEHLLSQADFVSFHVPLSDATKHLINRDRISAMRDGAVVLNFSRQGIVDDQAVLNALNDKKLYAYVCDFPTNAIKGHPRVVALPHLGASTAEAEDNCARMVVQSIRDYLENGTIHHSVNFPEAQMPRNEGDCRIAVVNANVPNMVGQISTALARAELNICDLLNKSKGEVAYTLVDLDCMVSQQMIDEIASIQGVLAVRVV